MNFFFWLKWDQPFRHITTLLFSVLLLLILASLVLISISPEGIIGWHVFSKKMLVNVITQTVDIGLFQFSFFEQLVIINEFFSGAEMPNTILAKKLTLLLIFGLFSLILTLISYFNRWVFIIFSLFIFSFILFMHPEMLKITNLENNWIFAGLFVLFIAPSYYFQAFKRNASFGIRFFTLAIVVILFLSLAVWKSGVTSPLNSLFSYGILAPYIVVLFFVLLVGHEIVNGFAIVITDNKDKFNNGSIKHFLIITFIYLLNILVSYLQITHVIDWNFISINPFIILASASVFGVWGISKRFVVYEKVSSNQKIWVLLYLALAVVSFVTITYLHFSLEDTMLKIIGDFIIFTQLSFGIAFLIYILYNFSFVIEKGHSIGAILYKPTNLPYLSYRLIGFLILTSLVFLRDVKYPIWYSIGGFYNSLAGYFEDQENDALTLIYYEKGADLSMKNHKSNYKLGMLNTNTDEAIKRFGYATSRVASPQAFINKSNLESKEGMFFDALFTLQSGIARFPNSNKIQNNLALQFQKADLLDSAWYYLTKDKTSTLAKNNALAFVFANNLSISESDSSFLFSNLDNVGASNAAILGVKSKDISDFSTDSPAISSFLMNVLTNQLIPYSDSAYHHILLTIDSLENKELNEELYYALALYELKNERITDALKRLQKLTAYSTKRQAIYFETLGLINLKYGSYNEAVKYFKLAIQESEAIEKQVLPKLAMAQSEAGYLNEALSTWKRIKEEGRDNEESSKANLMYKVLNSIVKPDVSNVDTDDISLSLKARYERFWVDEYAVKTTFTRIKNKSIRNQLAIFLSEYYFRIGNSKTSKLFYALIDTAIIDRNTLKSLYYLNIKLAYGGELQNLDKHIKKFADEGFKFSKNKRLEELFFKMNRKELTSKYAERFSNENPYFAEAVVWAANYFSNSPEIYKSYSILQEALEKNPDNKLLLEAYILKALEMGLEEYANNSMQHYREIFPGTQFHNFEKKILSTINKLDTLNEKE